jgi:hypothetical protein
MDLSSHFCLENLMDIAYFTLKEQQKRPESPAFFFTLHAA